MEIRLYKDSDRKAWDNYVLSHPKGTFFHLTGWKRVVEKSFGHKSYYLIALERRSSNVQQPETRNQHASFPASSNQPATRNAQPVTRNSYIAGIFPLFTIKSLLFGSAIVSLPFATYGGILADNQEVENALFREAVTLTENTGVDYLEMRSEESAMGDLPVKDLYYGFKTHISSDEDQNLQSIPRKSRRMVRMGMKNGLHESFGGEELLDQFYDLFAFSYQGFGTPVFSKKYLRNLLREFGNGISILMISKNDHPLSGVLSFYYKDQVIPYYSGAYPDARSYAANDYLYWVLMRDAAQKGYRVFDFGRSKKDTGPYHFKRHWGFSPRPLPYQYYLNNIDELPNISPTNPKYKQCIELWKKLPLWATKIMGPQIVKFIP